MTHMLRSSLTRMFLMGSWVAHEIPLKVAHEIPLRELTTWLTLHGGMALDQIVWVKGYFQRLQSKEASNVAAHAGQQ